MFDLFYPHASALFNFLKFTCGKKYSLISGKLQLETPQSDNERTVCLDAETLKEIANTVAKMVEKAVVDKLTSIYRSFNHDFEKKYKAILNTIALNSDTKMVEDLSQSATTTFGVVLPINSLQQFVELNAAILKDTSQEKKSAMLSTRFIIHIERTMKNSVCIESKRLTSQEFTFHINCRASVC